MSTESPTNGAESTSDEALDSLFDLSGDDYGPDEDVSPKRRTAIRAEDLQFLSPMQQCIADRVDDVLRLLGRGARKGEIKRAIKSKYGVSSRTIENDMSRARLKLRAVSGRSGEEHLDDSLAFHMHIIRNAKATIREKQASRDRLDKLLGVDEFVESRVGRVGKVTPLIEVRVETREDVENFMTMQKILEQHPDAFKFGSKKTEALAIANPIVD